MCGIAGVVNASGVSYHDVKSMISSIQYRGVNELSVEEVGPHFMAHARLSIVDVAHGHQPMVNEDGTVSVVFNGEIYNAVELREELIKKGHVFKSVCDTEVLVHLWEEEGENMLKKLIGMFAFFVWDERQQKGILARDRQGIKPCFIAEYREGIAFCSEMKGILSLPNFPQQLREESLLQVFRFNYALPPETCFKNISHLPHGHYLLIEKGKRPIQKKYWEWPFFAPKKSSSIEEFSALMSDVTRIQMRFDVKGGMFFSGGVDSSVVASELMPQWNKNHPLEGLSLSFQENTFSEFSLAQESAAHLGMNVSPVNISADMIPSLAEKVSHVSEQPHGDFSFFLFYVMSQQAHQDGKIVMFNGDGPDEALAGYVNSKMFSQQVDDQNDFEKSYYQKISYMQDQDMKDLLSHDLIYNNRDGYEMFQEKIMPWKSLSTVEQRSGFECDILLAGNNLVKTDRMGAFWSIEGRSPFLDHRVSELFVRLPWEEKTKEGIGKYFLKKYALKSFPKELIFRNKSMPTMPIGEWLKGPLYGWAHELLSSLKTDIVNAKAALKYLDSHKKGEQNHTRQLRTLLMFAVWEKVFFKR